VFGPPIVGFIQWSGSESMLSLFQQSYKGFKGKFLKVRCNKRDPTLLDGFPLYWTQKPTFQGARCLKSMPQWDEEVCHFFSNLKVVFDTTTFISQEFSPGGLKAYIGIFPSFTLTDANFLISLLNFPCFSCRRYVG